MPFHILADKGNALLPRQFAGQGNFNLPRNLGVLGGQSVQYATGVVGHYSFFKECFELFLCQRYGVGDKAFKKPHAAA